MRGTGRRILFIVLDGVADRPSDSLGGRTPLEAADTPTLDRLAAAGASGLVDVGPPGTPMPSDRAHAILFGYDLDEVPRRGVLEARGFEVPIPDGGVAVSASFALLEPSGTGWRVTDRKVEGYRDDCRAATELVSGFSHEDVYVSMTYTWKNRGIVTLGDTDIGLSGAVTDIDPFETNLPVLCSRPTVEARDDEAAGVTADVLSRYTRWTVDRLADAPVDIVLSKWAGTAEVVPSFRSQQGMTGAMITSKPVLRGLGVSTGLDVVEPPSPYEDRIQVIHEVLDDYEFVHVHYPEPDLVAHTENPPAKRAEIESIDASLGSVVDRALSDDELVTAVTADHTTPSEGNVVHSGEPVPVTIVGSTVRSDDVTEVGERPAASGGVGRIAGRDILRLLRAAADRVLLNGLRRTPELHDHPAAVLEPLSQEVDRDR